MNKENLEVQIKLVIEDLFGLYGNYDLKEKMEPEAWEELLLMTEAKMLNFATILINGK